jgi:outer membrane protein assembly factor BamB
MGKKLKLNKFLAIMILFSLSNDKMQIQNKQKTFNTNILNTTHQESVWPMFHHDSQHTGRSHFGMLGNTPIIKWRFQMDGMMISSPAINEDGTIYIGAEDYQDNFFAIKPDGTEKWRFDAGDWVLSSPAIGDDGTIYVGSTDSNLYAFYPNGTLLWNTHLGAGWVFSSPVVDLNEIIYAASTDGCNLCAVYPNGTIKWTVHTNDSIFCSPALDEEGNIYIGSNDGYLYSIFPNGTVKWKYYAGGPKGIGAAPTIGEDDTIYFGCTSGYFYALYPNGTLKWKLNTGYIGGSSAAIKFDGTIYVGTNDGVLYSISSSGVENWRFNTGVDILSSPAIDKNGLIYFGSLDGYLYALNPNGTLRWKFKAGDGIESSPAIGEDGTIYIAGQFQPSAKQSSYTYLYALEIIDNQPPAQPIITGETNGKKGTEYTYTAVSSDPDNDNISYFFDWGDGTSSGWTEFTPSVTIVNRTHTWNRTGIYTIQVKAMDENGAESDWAILDVTMPFSYERPLHVFLEHLFERTTNIFPILRYLLKN